MLLSSSAGWLCIPLISMAWSKKWKQINTGLPLSFARPAHIETWFYKFSHESWWYYDVYDVQSVRITITKQISSALHRKLMRSSNGSRRFTYLFAFFQVSLCFVCIYAWFTSKLDQLLYLLRKARIFYR